MIEQLSNFKSPQGRETWVLLQRVCKRSQQVSRKDIEITISVTILSVHIVYNNSLMVGTYSHL